MFLSSSSHTANLIIPYPETENWYLSLQLVCPENSEYVNLGLGTVTWAGSNEGKGLCLRRGFPFLPLLPVGASRENECLSCWSLEGLALGLVVLMVEEPAEHCTQPAQAPPLQGM